jgi:chromosome segregation ATPase
MVGSKLIVRSLVVAGALGGTALVIAGPERLGAIGNQTRDSINAVIDQHIEDPVALRSQLRSLQGQYPVKIAEVRGDLAELQAQSAQLNRELEVSERVVALADSDLSSLQGLIGKAETTQTAMPASMGGMTPIVQIVFANETMNLTDAYARANHIREVKETYAARQADIERDRGYLSQQEQRLSDLLAQLEREQTEFQTQIFALDRQIDAIARNTRMIDVMEKRQASIEEHSRYKAHSLDQLTGRLADMRAKQEAQLQSLGKTQTTQNYENRAKFDLDARSQYHNNLNKADQTSVKVKPPVIRITPDSPDPISAPRPTSTSVDATPVKYRANG